MTSALTPLLVTRTPMARMGNTGYSGLPTASLFVARDGREVSLGVVQPNQFAALARHVGREGWLADPRFSTPDARRAHFEPMKAELATIMLTRDAAQWERELSAIGVPCGMVRRVDEAAALAGTGALLPISIPGLPGGSEVAIPNAGFSMMPDGPGTSVPPPMLDEHRQEILDWLGLGDIAQA